MRNRSSWDVIREAPMAWDKTGIEPTAASPKNPSRPPPVPIKIKDAAGRPVAQRRLPGVSEAVPSTAASGQQQPPRRRRSDNTQPPPFSSAPAASIEPTAAAGQSIPLSSGEKSWDVFVPGDGTYRVPAGSSEEATSRTIEYLRDQGERRSPDPRMMRATLSSIGNEGVGAAAMGGQPQTSYDEALESLVRTRVRETIRKKAGGGGYKLYAPNSGKKKKPKSVGEFPTRLAAKRAELAQFPPKDPDQLKRARTRLDKITRDPKKRSKAEQDDLAGRKRPKHSGAPDRERKRAKRESLTLALARDLRERLFHEDEVPGSPWDERINSLHPDAVASDRKLAGLHKNIERASIGSLGDAHRGLSKVLRGTAKVNPGDIAHDQDRGKTFMPVMLDCDGTEIGPVHLYVDGGDIKVEVSRDARQQIAELEPDAARDLRGGLMSFEEDHLPKIDGAKKAWQARDSYLDRLHGRLERHAAGLSGVESHLLRQMLSGGGRRR